LSLAHRRRCDREGELLELADDPVGFANSGGVVFVDESAEKVATT
jgi:hypothetical protein